jgi:hypothetical protein
MTATITNDQAVRGRRIELTYYRDLPDGPQRPGIITRVDCADTGGAVWIRLDGTRYTIHARHDYEGLKYLDEVVPVPDLPMGRFTPVADDENGFWEYASVLLATIGEDGEDLVLITDDLDRARAAATTYAREIGIDPDFMHFEGLHPYWAVFEWQPEDAESPWTIRWDAAEDDDKAVRIYHLPG